MQAGGVNAGQEHQAEGIHQQVTLSALQPFSAIIAPLWSAHAGALHALAVHDGGAGLGITFFSGSHPATQPLVKGAQRAIGPPTLELTVNGLPRREVRRQEPPSAAGP